jgi:hypothetical protein
MLKVVLIPVALVFVFLAASGGSQSVQAVTCGPYCDMSWGGTTPAATAIGASCAIAQTNLNTQLQSYANTFCGTRGCNLVVTTTVACHATGSGYSVTGYATFGCRDSTC